MLVILIEVNLNVQQKFMDIRDQRYISQATQLQELRQAEAATVLTIFKLA